MDLPCCFEACPNPADSGRPLQVAKFRWSTFHQPVAEAVEIRPCAAHRLAVNLTAVEASLVEPDPLQLTA